MIGENYANADTDELIRWFVEGAKQVGAGYDQQTKLPHDSAEARVVRTALRAIAEELRSRGTVETVRRLYDDADPDVRTWACGQLGFLDQEWAAAGMAGISEKLTATEVMALHAQARQPVPQRPSLPDMSIEQLLARFENAGLRRYVVQYLSSGEDFPGMKKINRLIAEMREVVEELQQCGALAALLPLLDDPNLIVRYVAAVNCLPIAPAKALPVIEEMADGIDPVQRLIAREVLKEWRGKAGEVAQP